VALLLERVRGQVLQAAAGPHIAGVALHLLDFVRD
jgi:hypothetical protein